VTLNPIFGCVPPARGTGRALIKPLADGDWWVSWQGFGLAVNECVSVTCTTKAEAVEWALAQPAAEWMICRDEHADVWEHLR
jgi:hypothetical protein